VVIRGVAMAMLTVMTVVSGSEVVARALFNVSFAWAQEVSVLAAMWVYFFAYALVAKSHDYLRVDFVVRQFPLRLQKQLQVVSRILVACFYAVVFYYALQTLRFLSLFHTEVLELPEYLLVLPLALGTIDVVLTEIIYLVRQLQGQAVPGSIEAAGAGHGH
jgi:TRAP-type C4-dicarboxylate transport system permease small subunit